MSVLSKKLRNLFRRDDGTQMIEFAIVFPVLLLLFAGTAELGRLFYTYTTLAKATRGGARYLSLVKDTDWSGTSCQTGSGTLAMSCTTAGKNVVMCGNPGGCGGAGQPAVILPNLTASNIVITPPPTTGTPRFETVAITGYTYQPLVFNLNAMTGGNFNLTLTPSTTMRFMRY
jgi:Flp pilus assembly protein TadG